MSPIHLPKMENRLPVGPGSRGGQWHNLEFRRAYHRAWRASHPEYREREILRRRLAKAAARGDELTSDFRLAPGKLPEPAAFCRCNCDCKEPVVLTCGFCREGQHQEEP